jgi:AcrR family transcriptional regulator
MFVLIKRLFNFAFEKRKRTMNYNDKQLQIIETAEGLFADRGFDGTSVRDIAEVAGINVAMISYYFGSKEKLMEALFEIKIEKIKDRLESLLKDEVLTPFQKVNIMIDEQIERMWSGQRFYKIMLCEQLIDTNPSITNKVSELKLRNAELVNKIVKDGQQKGVFKKDVDVVLMLNTMIGTSWQTLVSQDYYRNFGSADQALPDEAYKKELKTKLSIHIKTLFKAILSYEA